MQNARKNGDLLAKIQSNLEGSTRSALSASLPGLSAEIQKIAEAQAVQIVNSVSNLIPGQAEMVALGNRIVASIEKSIDENILPQLYNRTTLGAAFISDNELKSIYNRALSNIPSRTTFDVVLGQQITLNIKSIVQAALPLSKFMQMVRKIEPLTYTIKAKTLPLVEGRIKDVGAFTMFTGMLVGGLITFGYMKLYNSID